MLEFLVDVNLPFYCSLWNNPAYIHQTTINDEWTDQQIWAYAKANNLSIITKDSDFADLILFREPPPKIIHIRLGNMKMRDFFRTLQQHWTEALFLNQTHKLVTVYKDRIEAMD